MRDIQQQPPSPSDSARALSRPPNPRNARRRNSSNVSYRRTFNNSNRYNSNYNSNQDSYQPQHSNGNVNHSYHHGNGNGRDSNANNNSYNNKYSGQQYYRRNNYSNANNSTSSKMKPTDCCATTTTTTATNNVSNNQNQTASSSASTAGSAFHELSVRQVERLRSVLHEEVEIHGKENFPTLRIALHKLISHVRRKLRERDLNVKHVKLNGGAASYCLANDDFVYSDLDLIFPIDLSRDGDFERVRAAVFDALVELMPGGTNKQMICADTLKDIYIRKMVKVSDEDCWSLFSLHNNYGRCIELKFVDKMRRQFEFSVDSFQITLDPLIEAAAEENDKTKPRRVTVTAESMYGDFPAALRHLNKRLIDTRKPAEIRGGGLLKYCHLLCKGYSATQNCREMETYMCSRFFIDFSDVNMQEMKLRQYLENHFGSEDEQKFQYLKILNTVIKESTVCLMGHERRSTQNMIERLRQQLSYNMFYPQQETLYEHTPRQVLLYLPQNSNHWIRVV